MKFVFSAPLVMLLCTSASAQVSTFCVAVTNSTGSSAAISANGSLDVFSNSLTLDCTNLPDRTFGAFMVDTSTALSTTPGGSVGNLCLTGLTGSAGLFVGASIQQASGGAVSFSPDMTNLPLASGGAAMPGDTLHFQYWYRDVSAAGGATSNFTGGVTVAFAPSFAAEIFPLFDDSTVTTGSRCASCHSGTAPSGSLDLSGTDASAVYALLVGVPAAGPTCSAGGPLLVDPGNADNSKLWQLVSGTIDCGPLMTYNNTGDMDRLRAWIEAGAPDN